MKAAVIGQRGLYEVDFGHFKAYVWSTPEKIISDLKNLYDEQGASLVGRDGSTYQSIKFICNDFEILEVGTEKVRL